MVSASDRTLGADRTSHEVRDNRHAGLHVTRASEVALLGAHRLIPLDSIYSAMRKCMKMEKSVAVGSSRSLCQLISSVDSRKVGLKLRTMVLQLHRRSESS